LSPKQEWRNSLLISESFSRTPAIKSWIKAGDVLSFESIYLYKLASWMGVYARFGMDTALFEGSDVRPTPVKYSIQKISGGSPEVVMQSRLRLTESFSPLTLKESAGLFARPITGVEKNLEFRFGFGAREVFADGALMLADDAGTTDVVEVKETKSYNQAGGEFASTFWGALAENKVAYKLGFELMTPLIRDKDKGDDRSALEMTNIEFKAALSFKLVSWASLDYEFRALKQPQLIEDFQFQNNLLLTLTYTLFQ